MSLLKLLSVSLVASLGCASVEIPDLRPHVTLPGTQNGFWVSTLEEKEGEIKAEAWKKYLEENAHVILFSEDWAKLRFTLLKNCLTMDCKQSVGMLDDLFKMVDDGLKKKKSLTGK
jgi:hypothetical protein